MSIYLKQLKFIFEAIIIALFLLFMFSSTIYAEDITNHSKKLNTVLNKINLLQKHISSDKSKRNSLQNEVRQTEIKIGRIAYDIEKTKKDLIKTQKSLKENEKKQLQYQEKLKKQKILLSTQILAMYKFGKQPFLKIILNQENPEEINRYLYYYKIFNDSRITNIHKIEGTSKLLKDTIQKIQKENQNLKKMKWELISQQQSIKKEKKHREFLIKITETNIKKEHLELSKLNTDKKRLENIIKILKQQKFGLLKSGENFKYMRHLLHFPISSNKIIQRFGQPINGTSLSSTGIVFSTQEGEEVHAIFPGRVVFADWLKGFGLLVIIQHDNNYMSLYGRNQSLYIKTNQIVQTGDVIATTGNSGGFENSSLYFEIRYKGKPQNPMIWLKS